MAGLKQSKRVSWPTDGNLCKRKSTLLIPSQSCLFPILRFSEESTLLIPSQSCLFPILRFSALVWKAKRFPTSEDVCQSEVRLFISEDAPCQSGLGGQDHLQAKAAWLLHAEGLVDSDDFLPPGFEAPHKHQPQIEISQIPIIKWQCPPTLFLNPEWRVVAGGESEEVYAENRRQPGVLEAVYPRLSSIPPNSSVAPEVQAARVDDSCPPLITITAIEEEDGTDQPDTVPPPNNAPRQLHSLPNAGTPQSSTPELRLTFEQLNSQLNVVTSMPNLQRSEQTPLASVMPTAGPAPVAEPDVLAAASAAFTAIMRSSEEGSLIDRDLLIKILSNPVVVEKLASEYGVPEQNLPMPPVVSAASAPSHQHVVITPAAPSRHAVFTAPAASSLRPPPPQMALSAPLSAPPMSHMFHVPNTVLPPGLNLRHPPPMSHHPCPMPIVNPVQASAPPMKDANYYKSLIQLHGGDKAEALDQNAVQVSNLGNSLDYHSNMNGASNGGDLIGVGGPNQRDLKPKVLKPCVYFNTARGCRHGASCLYQHDASSVPQRTEQNKGTSKRIKLDSGIAGSN